MGRIMAHREMYGTLGPCAAARERTSERLERGERDADNDAATAVMIKRWQDQSRRCGYTCAEHHNIHAPVAVSVSLMS